MDYYIQGDAARAEEIKAAFERLGIDTNNYGIGNDCYIYYSSNGLLYFDDFSDTLLNVFKSHPGYTELPLPVKPMFKAGDWITVKE